MKWFKAEVDTTSWSWAEGWENEQPTFPCLSAPPFLPCHASSWLPGVHCCGLLRLGKTTFPDLFVPFTPLLTYSMPSPQDPEPLLNEFEVRWVLTSKTSFLLGNDAILVSAHSAYNATSNLLLEVSCTWSEAILLSCLLRLQMKLKLSKPRGSYQSGKSTNQIISPWVMGSIPWTRYQHLYLNGIPSDHLQEGDG